MAPSMAIVEQASGWWPSFTEVGAKGAEEALVGDGYLGCAEHAPYDAGPADRRRDRDTTAFHRAVARRRQGGTGRSFLCESGPDRTGKETRRTAEDAVGAPGAVRAV
jgi:hypothetical protein